MNCQPQKIKSALKNFPAKFRITVFDCKAQAARQEKKIIEKYNNFGVLNSVHAKKTT
jgi:hypothetical protein